MSVATMSVVSTNTKEAPVRWRGFGSPLPEPVAREVAEAVESTYELLGARPSTSAALSVDDFSSAEATLQAATTLLTGCVDDPGNRVVSGGVMRDALRVLVQLAAAQRVLDEARAQQRRTVSAQIEQAMGRLNGADSLSELVDSAPEEVCRLGFDRAFISKVQGSTWIPEAVHIVGDPDWAATILAAGRSQPQHLTHLLHDTEMVRRRMPLLVTNVQEDSRVHRPIAAASRSGSYVAAPILSREGKVIGFLHADRFLQGRHVDESDRDALWSFAQGFSRALERVVLTDRLRGLRGVVARLTDDIREVMGQFVDGQIEVAQVDPLRVQVLPSAARAYVPEEEVSSLTRREGEVLRLMCEGETNAAIAARLVISEGTVKSHVKHILRKLGAANRAEAVSLYFRAEQDARDNGILRAGRFGSRR